ncbi:MAG TPA: hypothetical protein VMP13_09195 [Acidimicrobiia bacterium]|nr:hypothetical protein [Acidimicrobiia bacterium]
MLDGSAPSLGETLAKHSEALLVCAAIRGDDRDASQRTRGALPGSSSALQGVAADDTVCSAVTGKEGVALGLGPGHIRPVGDSLTLHRIAARQHGAFSLDQARAAGFDRSATYRRVSNGMWSRRDDSVYALTSAPVTWRQRLWTAVLSRERAVLTHWSACRLFGISDVPQQSPAVLVPRGANTRSTFSRVFESDQFDDIAVTDVEGLPVTTMPETILVLARDVKGDVLIRVFDEAIISGLLDLKVMAATIDREAGRRTPGTPLLRT